jgi:hypothetical protein
MTSRLVINGARLSGTVSSSTGNRALETGSLMTVSSSGESLANLSSSIGAPKYEAACMLVD